MIHVTNELDIARRKPSEVFAFVADFRNEARWNDFNRQPTKLTAGDVGVGTRFSSQNVKLGPCEVEIVEHVPPERLVMQIVTKMGVMRFEALFSEHAGGTRMKTRNELSLRGLYWLMTPFVSTMVRREAPMHQQELKQFLEEKL